MKIIGLSGTNGSGKDTVAHMLVEKHGFYFASASEMFEEELRKRGLPFEREQKRTLSAEWRREYGLAAVVDEGLRAAQAAGAPGLVVGSLRNDGEVDRVHELGGIMIWTDADPKIRYDRITSANRGRIEDQKSFDQFLAEEAVEMESDGDPAKLNMAIVKQKADIVMMNDFQSIDEFIQSAQEVLKDVL